MKVYEAIASAVAAYENCTEPGVATPVGEQPGAYWSAWVRRHAQRADKLASDYLPSGSGFDCGTKIDWDRTTSEKLVLYTSFHHMDEHGCYDGWTDHTVIVRPALIGRISLSVSGRNRNDIKEYIAETMQTALCAEFQPPNCYQEAQS